MKKTRLRHIFAAAVASAVALTASPIPALAADSGDFHQDLAQMLAAQDSSAYFDLMQMEIGSTTFSVDGQQQQLDVAPAVKNQRTMLPIRAVAEAAGAEIDYDSSRQAVVITGAYGDEIICPTGASSMTVNGESLALDAPSYVENNRTYMPVRAVSEALNLDVIWDADEGVIITAPWQTSRLLAWTNSLDANSLGASAAIEDGNGLWVLQFATPAEAKAAAETLESRGITAKPDLYIPPVDPDDGDAGISAATYSWGVQDCGFDTFVKNHTFSGSSSVAVIDTGVDASHSFLSGKVLPGRDFVSGDNDPKDEHYHGTHVAGTIIDCAGTAPVKILPVRVLDARGSGYDSTIVSGVRYAADQGTDVLNLSLGGKRSSSSTDNIDRAIQYAVGKGSLVVVAAGNDNMDTSKFCPAHITTAGVIVVSAGDAKHSKAYFSNYGSSVDVMAPGVNIKAAVPGNGYKSLNGTSMASPHAVAAAALLDLASGKSLTPANLEQKVRSATSNGGTWKDKYVGCGFLDLTKADPGSTPNPTPAPVTPEITGYRFSSTSLSLKAGESGSLKVTAVYSDNTTKDVTSTSGLYSTNTSVATVDKNGTVKALKEGTTRISIGTTASSNLSIPAPVTVTVKPTDTPAPTPDKKLTGYRFSESSLTMEEGGTASLKVTATYSDGSTKDVTSEAGLYSTSTSVATVDKNGTVKAVKAGSTRISMGATPEGNISIPAPVNVKVTAKSDPPPVTPDPPKPDDPDKDDVYTRLYWGISRTGDTDIAIHITQGTTLQVDVLGDTKSGKTVTLTKDCKIESSDSSVINISSSGKLTAAGKGEAYIYITSAPNTGLSLPPILEFIVE